MDISVAAPLPGFDDHPEVACYLAVWSSSVCNSPHPLNCVAVS